MNTLLSSRRNCRRKRKNERNVSFLQTALRLAPGEEGELLQRKRSNQLAPFMVLPPFSRVVHRLGGREVFQILH